MLRSTLFCTACALGALLAAAPVGAQWEATGGPAGTRFYDLAATESAVFASPYGPVYRHTEAGWNAALPDPTYDLVATGALVLAPSPDGLLRSTDHGASFTPLPGTGSRWLPLRPDGDHLFAVDRRFDFGPVLQRSDDDGATWQAIRDSLWVEPEGGSGFSIELANPVGAVVEGDAVLAAASAYVFGGLFRLAPGDSAWVPLFGSTAGSLEESIQPTDFFRYDGALWLFYRVGFGSETFVVASADGGATWTDASAGLPSDGFFRGAEFGSAGLFVQATSGLYRWSGAAWTALPAPSVPVSMLAVGARVYAANETDVFVLDGQAWSALPEVVGSSPVLVGAGDAVGGGIWVQWNGMLRSYDDGASFLDFADWRGPAAAGGGFLLSMHDDGFVRIEGGTPPYTWLPRPPLPQSFRETARPNALVWDGEAFVAFYGAQRVGHHGILLDEFGGVYRLEGDTWRTLTANLPMAQLGRAPVRYGAALPGGLFAFTDRGCYVLESGDASWSERGCPGEHVWDVQADGDRWVASASTGPVVSADRGATWTAVDGGLPPFNAYTADLVPTSAGLLLLYDEAGSPQAARLDGDAWTALDARFPDAITLTNFLEHDGYLYAGSQGAGLWRSPLDFALSTGTENEAVADALALLPPAPNPARDAVAIRYVLPEAGEATVDVLDILGRRVAVLASGRQPAGEQTTRWSALGLSPGLYLVRLQTPDGIRVQRVTVAR